MAEQEPKQASQQPTEGAPKGADETTYPEFFDLSKEGGRKLKVKASGEERVISLNEAYEKYIPSGIAYTPEQQRWKKLVERYGTEDYDTIIANIKAERDNEYSDMLGDKEYHPDFIKALNEKGFEVVITPRGTGKLVDKSTQEPLSKEELDNLDPQTRKLWEAQQQTINALRQELDTVKKGKEEYDAKFQAIENTRQDEKIRSELGELKTKFPNITDSQIDKVKALAVIDTQIAFSQTPRREPKSLSAIYTELNEAFGKGMSEQDVAGLKKKWLEEQKNPPQTEGAGTGSPSPEEKLPQTKKEYYDKMIKEKNIPLNPRPGDY